MAISNKHQTDLGREKIRHSLIKSKKVNSSVLGCFNCFQVGSFVFFPLSKQIERPLLLLNKYLR